MLSNIIVTVYNIFSIVAWTAVLLLTIQAALKSNTWLEFGDTYTDDSLLRKMTLIAQGTNALDIIFGAIGWTKNGVVAPFS